MRHWILVAFCAFLQLTLVPVFATRAADMPKFEQAVEPACNGVDPICGTVTRLCLSAPAFVALVKRDGVRPIFMGEETATSSTIVIVMAPDNSIGLFVLEASGRACLLGGTAGPGSWDKKTIKSLFLGNGREIEI